MGLALYLLPFDATFAARAAAPGFPALNYTSQTVLSSSGSEDLFDVLKGLPSAPVPATFTSFVGDQEYDLTTEDAHGDPVRTVSAGMLCTVQDHPGVTTSAKNRAIWAYLAALPADTPVALYWH